jgi:hypothetical protein
LFILWMEVFSLSLRLLLDLTGLPMCNGYISWFVNSMFLFRTRATYLFFITT